MPAFLAATVPTSAGTDCVPGQSPADATIRTPLGQIDSGYDTLYIIFWSSHPNHPDHIHPADIWVYRESTVRPGLQRADVYRDDSCGDPGFADAVVFGVD